MKNSFKSRLGLGLAMALAVTAVSAGPLDPDCTAEKAAKSAAAKATIGVGGRCDPKEAVHDTAKIDRHRRQRQEGQERQERQEEQEQ